MINPVDCRALAGGESGDDQRRGSAQIRRHHRRARQGFPPAHRGDMVGALNVGAHSLQFLYVHKTIFEDGFRNRRRPFGQAVDRHYLRLQIGRKSGIGRGLDIHRGESSLHFNRQPRRRLAAPQPSLLERGENFLQILLVRLPQDNLPATSGDRGKISSGFNAVGHHPMIHARQGLGSAHPNNRAAGRR